MNLTNVELLQVVQALPDGELKDKFQEELDDRINEHLRSREHERRQRQLDADGICIFERSWSGRCTRHSWNGADVQMCKEHFETKCRVCGEQAYLSCSDFSGSFVCGMDVCKQHERHQPDDSHKTWHERVADIRQRWENEVCE